MKLTTKQVADKLGVSTFTVGLLARKGTLPALNKSENGKRVAYLFDSKVVGEFKKAYNPRRGNGHVPPLRRVTVNMANPPMGLLSTIVKRLNAVDDKLDQIISLWS